jgi:hypothetical protein
VLQSVGLGFLSGTKDVGILQDSFTKMVVVAVTLYTYVRVIFVSHYIQALE